VYSTDNAGAAAARDEVDQVTIKRRRQKAGDEMLEV
jgi:hypothetical protein